MSMVNRWRRAEPVEFDVLDAYQRWASDYAPEAHNPLMQIQEQAMQELLPQAAGPRLLDLACASGRYLKRLAAGGGQRALDWRQTRRARPASPAGRLRAPAGRAAACGRAMAGGAAPAGYRQELTR